MSLARTRPWAARSGDGYHDLLSNKHDGIIALLQTPQKIMHMLTIFTVHGIMAHEP